MNLQQLEYILAVDKHRHFARAAESSFVTQPTLSMMIQKLEDELGIKIFDRSRQPVVPTAEGEEILAMARRILSEVSLMKEYTAELKGEVSGTLHLGIIPTLAPYLLPLFIKPLAEKHPQLTLYIKEMVTDEIINKLHSGELDMGILATPLHEAGLEEHPLFYEEFLAYASRNEKLRKKKYLAPQQIDPSQLWLLEEGHCLRNQVLNLCELKKKEIPAQNLHYEAGSIETLINLVDKYEGITIIPKLAAQELSATQQKNLIPFTEPRPSREVSLVIREGYPRKKVLESVREEIDKAVPLKKKLGKKTVIEI